jgi:SulP family sulfate permease
VLIAVVVTTTISWAIGFENNLKGNTDQVADTDLKAMIKHVADTDHQLKTLNLEIADKSAALLTAEQEEGKHSQNVVAQEADLTLSRMAAAAIEAELNALKGRLRHVEVVRALDASGATAGLYVQGKAPAEAKLDGYTYRIRKVDGEQFRLVGGGEVVGSIPEGLPSISLPSIDLGKLGSLLSVALVISLVGFMEAISIAKAIAAKTKQRIDPNQELIGQGLANVVGSFSQAFPVSGSFSRSAVNMNAGARTGMSAVFTAIIVLAALLFLTPLLYHLPQAVLAAIIIMAVIGLVNVHAIKEAWQAHKHDGAAAIVTFVATLVVAPHLDQGIMIGAGLAIVLYLLRTMTPRVAILGRYSDGTLRDIKVNPNLATSRHVVAMRFDGSLYFANVSYFEDAVLEAMADHPEAKYILIVGDAINQLDASGEEVVHHLVERLRENGVQLVFSGLKKQVLDVMRNTHLLELIATENQALAAIYERLGTEAADDLLCPILPSRA